MSTRLDTDGKTFSHVVHTQGLSVVVRTENNIIRGTLHLRDNERVKDAMNTSEEFLAVTNARVFDSKGETVLHETNFLALNRQSIAWVFEDEAELQEFSNGQ